MKIISCLAICFLMALRIAGAMEFQASEIIVKWAEVSIDSIDADVDSEEESVKVRFYAKGKSIGGFKIDGVSLKKVFDDAVQNRDENEAFFGPGRELFVSNAQEGAFYVLLESSGERFQITPLVKLGDDWFFSSKFAYTSRDPKVLEALRRLLEPEKKD